MARKRVRKNVKRDGFVFPGPLLAVLLMAAAIALAYLWLTARCEAMAQQIRDLEKQARRLREQRRIEEFRWWSMSSPEKIMRALRRRGLRMDWPRDSQVFYVELQGGGQAGSAELARLNPAERARLYPAERAWRRRRAAMND